LEVRDTELLFAVAFRGIADGHNVALWASLLRLDLDDMALPFDSRLGRVNGRL
jgi:hypothetical protein